MTVVVHLPDGGVELKTPHESHKFVNIASLPNDTIWQCSECGLCSFEFQSLYPCCYSMPTLVYKDGH